jgi:hypothetical protein
MLWEDTKKFVPVISHSRKTFFVGNIADFSLGVGLTERLASQRTRAVDLDVEAFSRRLYFKARGDAREDFFRQMM